MTIGLRIDSTGLVIRNPAGAVIFDSSYALEAVLNRFTGTLSLPTRAPEAAGAAPHTVDHDIGAAPTGAQQVRGWIRFEVPTDFQPAERPHSFGGSVVIQGAAYHQSAAGQIVYALRVLSPVIQSGRMLIREQYWNQDDVNPPRTLDAVDVEYDICATRFLGGS